jgi:hypothetical protein
VVSSYRKILDKNGENVGKLQIFLHRISCAFLPVLVSVFKIVKPSASLVQGCIFEKIRSFWWGWGGGVNGGNVKERKQIEFERVKLLKMDSNTTYKNYA